MGQAAPTQTALVRRARRINRELARLYPDAHIELNFTSPLELLVAAILSAQTTDRQVNEATRVLFARYRSAADYAAADRAELERVIRPTGFFRAKANTLIRLGQALCDRFGGEVPESLDELVTLPGVGRKTANMVLGDAFGKPSLTVKPTLPGWCGGSAGRRTPTRTRLSKTSVSCCRVRSGPRPRTG